VTALSWFNRRIRAFQPSGLRDALAYLEVPRSWTELIERVLATLRLDVGAGQGKRSTCPPRSQGGER
jgi:hypothetical protein